MNDEVNAVEAAPDEVGDEAKAKQLPDPAGIKILCAIPDLDKTYDGSIIERPEAFMQREHQATVVMFVLKLGPDCYTDKDRYPSGPWCAEGDFIITKAYAGIRFTVHGKAFAIIFEDEVQAVVQDPRGVGRA